MGAACQRPGARSRWSFPTCAAWGSPPSRPAATASRRRCRHSRCAQDRAAALVTHDIGNMVGYAFAAQYRNRVTCFVAIDAPLPGVGPWERSSKPLLWHFRFGGGHGRLVAVASASTSTGSGTSSPPPQSGSARRPAGTTRALPPGAMHAGFAQFATFDQDAVDNRAFVAAGKLDMPVLALGGEKSFGDDGRGDALCGKRRGRGWFRTRALDHGRRSQGYHRAGSRSRQGSIIPQLGACC